MFNDKKLPLSFPVPPPFQNKKNILNIRKERWTTADKISYGISFKLPDQKKYMKENRNAGKPDSHAEGAPWQMAKYPK